MGTIVSLVAGGLEAEERAGLYAWRKEAYAQYNAQFNVPRMTFILPQCPAPARLPCMTDICEPFEIASVAAAPESIRAQLQQQLSYVVNLDGISTDQFAAAARGVLAAPRSVQDAAIADIASSAESASSPETAARLCALCGVLVSFGASSACCTPPVTSILIRMMQVLASTPAHELASSPFTSALAIVEASVVAIAASCGAADRERMLQWPPLRAALATLTANASLRSYLHFAPMLYGLLSGPLVVVHATEGKAFLLEVTDIASIPQLHILLAGALIGNAWEGWLSGEPPAPEVVAAAGHGDTRHANDWVTGAWNLYTWQAIRVGEADVLLPPRPDDTRMWVWHDLVPTEQIPPRPDGTRVLLIGPPSTSRRFHAGRSMHALPGRVRVVRKLGDDEALTELRACARWKARVPEPLHPVEAAVPEKWRHLTHAQLPERGGDALPTATGALAAAAAVLRPWRPFTSTL